MSPKESVAFLLSSLTTRLLEAEISPEDALDELITVDPETMLGRALTAVMINISAVNLLDEYQGYTREDNIVNILLAQSTRTDKLKALINRIENEIEIPPDPSDESSAIVKAKLYRTNAGKKEFQWVVELQVLSQSVNDDDIPVVVDVEGNIDFLIAVLKKRLTNLPLPQSSLDVDYFQTTPH